MYLRALIVVSVLQCDQESLLLTRKMYMKENKLIDALWQLQ